jgi:hypothetical protein
MPGLTAEAVAALVTAACPSRHDEVVGGSLPRQREKCAFGHGLRHLDLVSGVADGACHAAAAALDRVHVNTWDALALRQKIVSTATAYAQS